MLFTRTYNVADVATVDELVEKLTQFSWCLCTGFRLGDLTFVNDASSEDGAQEFAVIKDGRQIESLTVSWMTADVLREVLTNLTSWRSRFEDYGAVTLNTNHVAGACRFCA